jgi:hypothetical protein
MEDGIMADLVDEVTEFLASYPPDVRDVALELRAQVLETIPGTREMLDRPARIVGYGFGTGYRDLICTIIPSKTGVKLGIAGGADLPDPNGLLHGAGKRHRYVAFGAPADVKTPGLKRLLEAAIAARKVDAGPGPRRATDRKAGR